MLWWQYTLSMYFVDFHNHISFFLRYFLWMVYLVPYVVSLKREDHLQIYCCHVTYCEEEAFYIAMVKSAVHATFLKYFESSFLVNRNRSTTQSFLAEENETVLSETLSLPLSLPLTLFSLINR